MGAAQLLGKYGGWTLLILGITVLACCACGARPVSEPIPATTLPPPEPPPPPGDSAPDGPVQPPGPTISVTVPLTEAIIVLPPDEKPVKDDDCTGLDSVLRELAASDYPSEFAGSHGLWMTEEGVGVEIELAEAEADLSPYEITVRNTRGLLLEAFVPVDLLCDLAEDPAVLRVSRLRMVAPL